MSTTRLSVVVYQMITSPGWQVTHRRAVLTCRDRRHRIVSYNVTINGGSAMVGYRPMTLADLAGHLSRAADDRTRWKLTWEFLEEYRRESSAVQPSLLRAQVFDLGAQPAEVTVWAAPATAAPVRHVDRERLGEGTGKPCQIP
jgi:hypothetical protein